MPNKTEPYLLKIIPCIPTLAIYPNQIPNDIINFKLLNLKENQKLLSRIFFRLGHTKKQIKSVQKIKKKFHMGTLLKQCYFVLYMYIY